MREYFVGRAICDMLEKGNRDETRRFLKNSFLSHEILFFAGKIMNQKQTDFDYSSLLLEFIEETRGVTGIDTRKLGYLGGNAVNLLYEYKGKLPPYDWRKLVLDGAILQDADLSGRDFTRTSFQHAKLDNANFTGSIFSHCNLTGVRFEETGHVQCIAISQGEKILALYRDGRVREWSHRPPNNPDSLILCDNIVEKSERSVKQAKMIPQPDRGLTILDERRLYFYDCDDKGANRRASISINPNFKVLNASKELLLLKEENESSDRIMLFDLESLAIKKSLSLLPVTFCDHLDNHAFIVYNQKEELSLFDLTNEKREKKVISNGERIACLATFKSLEVEGRYLLGLGLYDGTVRLLRIQVNEWSCENELEHSLYKSNESIKGISFINENLLAVCGGDKTIKRLSFDLDDLDENNCKELKEFKMSPQCRGMKIDGVTLEKEELDKLQALISSAAKDSC